MLQVCNVQKTLNCSDFSFLITPSMSKISDKRGKSWSQGFHLKDSKILARDPDLQFYTFHNIVVEKVDKLSASENKSGCSTSSDNKHFDIDTKTREDMIQFLNFVFEAKINQQEK